MKALVLLTFLILGTWGTEDVPRKFTNGHGGHQFYHAEKQHQEKLYAKKHFHKIGTIKTTTELDVDNDIAENVQKEKQVLGEEQVKVVEEVVVLTSKRRISNRSKEKINKTGVDDVKPRVRRIRLPRRRTNTNTQNHNEVKSIDYKEESTIDLVNGKSHKELESPVINQNTSFYVEEEEKNHSTIDKPNSDLNLAESNNGKVIFLKGDFKKDNKDDEEMRSRQLEDSEEQMMQDEAPREIEGLLPNEGKSFVEVERFNQSVEKVSNKSIEKDNKDDFKNYSKEVKTEEEVNSKEGLKLKEKKEEGDNNNEGLKLKEKPDEDVNNKEGLKLKEKSEEDNDNNKEGIKLEKKSEDNNNKEELKLENKPEEVINNKEGLKLGEDNNNKGLKLEKKEEEDSNDKEGLKFKPNSKGSDDQILVETINHQIKKSNNRNSYLNNQNHEEDKPKISLRNNTNDGKNETNQRRQRFDAIRGRLSQRHQRNGDIREKNQKPNQSQERNDEIKINNQRRRRIKVKNTTEIKEDEEAKNSTLVVNGRTEKRYEEVIGDKSLHDEIKRNDKSQANKSLNQNITNEGNDEKQRNENVENKGIKITTPNNQNKFRRRNSHRRRNLNTKDDVKSEVNVGKLNKEENVTNRSVRIKSGVIKNEEINNESNFIRNRQPDSSVTPNTVSESDEDQGISNRRRYAEFVRRSWQNQHSRRKPVIRSNENLRSHNVQVKRSFDTQIAKQLILGNVTLNPKENFTLNESHGHKEFEKKSNDILETTSIKTPSNTTENQSIEAEKKMYNPYKILEGLSTTQKISTTDQQYSSSEKSLKHRRTLNFPRRIRQNFSDRLEMAEIKSHSTTSGRPIDINPHHLHLNEEPKTTSGRPININPHHLHLPEDDEQSAEQDNNKRPTRTLTVYSRDAYRLNSPLENDGKNEATSNLIINNQTSLANSHNISNHFKRRISNGRILTVYTRPTIEKEINTTANIQPIIKKFSTYRKNLKEQHDQTQTSSNIKNLYANRRTFTDEPGQNNGIRRMLYVPKYNRNLLKSKTPNVNKDSEKNKSIEANKNSTDKLLSDESQVSNVFILDTEYKNKDNVNNYKSILIIDGDRVEETTKNILFINTNPARNNQSENFWLNQNKDVFKRLGISTQDGNVGVINIKNISESKVNPNKRSNLLMRGLFENSVRNQNFILKMRRMGMDNITTTASPLISAKLKRELYTRRPLQKRATVASSTTIPYYERFFNVTRILRSASTRMTTPRTVKNALYGQLKATPRSELPFLQKFRRHT